MMAGSGTLSATSAQTDANGYAAVTLTLTQIAANVQINACVAPGNSPCRAIYGSVVSPSVLNLQPVSGSAQATPLGTSFQPVIVRIVDNSSPPNPVLGVYVTFQTTVSRPTGNSPAVNSGETSTGDPAAPVILSTTQITMQSDASGLVGISPSVGAYNGTLEVDILVTAGTNAMLHYVLNAYPVMTTGSPPTGKTPLRMTPLPVPVRVRRGIGE